MKELEAVGVAKDRESVKLRGEVEECVRRGRVKEERERELQAKMKRAQKEQREMKEAHASQARMGKRGGEGEGLLFTVFFT